MHEYRRAKVFVREKMAGIISECDYGYEFTYDKHYLTENNASAISLTMPLKKESYQSKVLFPFFDGIIPEGWLLDIVVKSWKLEYRDRFGILLVACKDPIGVVSIEEVD